MPALARRLGVQVSSIYHHVDGRGAVVELVREAVTKDVDGAWFDTLPWDEAVEAWARGYRAAFAAHPSAVRLLATETIAAGATVLDYQSAAAGLLRAGFPEGRVLAVIVAIDDFMLGAAIDTAAPDEIFHLDADDPASASLRRVVAAAPKGPARAQQAFDVGLEAMIRGLREMLTADDRAVLASAGPGERR
ncbi:TetR family transcriptional regulator [Tsukamurella sp. TY48]|nr:TetR family transcriptional regulator [Tsukamurella sp. TY48]